MSLGETLRFVIDMNADGAIKEANRFGSTVESETKKGSTSIDNFSRSAAKFGTAAVGFGGAVLYGLKQTVDAYSEAEKQHLKLTTAVGNSSQKFTDNGEAIAKTAQHLQTFTTVEGDAAEAGAAMLVQFGLTQSQVQQLLPLVGDLSRRLGVDMESAAKKVGKAAAGDGAGGLTKMGIVLDDTAYSADAFGATVKGLQSTVGGFAENEAKTAAGKMVMLKNSFDDIKEGVGKGAADVLLSVVGPLGHIAEKGGAAAGALEMVGKAGAIIGTGSVLVGGMALAASTAAKLKNTLTQVSGEGENATRSLTTMGKAAEGVGVVMAALAVGEGVAALGNAISNTTGRAADDLNRFKIAAAGGKDASADLMKSFSDLAKSQKLSVTGSFIDLGETLNRNEVDMGGVTTATRKANDAFDQLAQSSPAGAKALLEQLSKYTDTLDHNSHQYDVNRKFIDEQSKSLELSAKAAKTATGATGDLGDATGDAASSSQDFADALKDTNGALDFIAKGASAASAAGKGFSDALDASSMEEVVTSSLKLGDAFHGIGDSVKDLPKNFDQNTAALGGYNDKQEAAIKAVTDWGDAASGQIKTLIESGASTDDVTAKANVYTSALTGVMKQAGMSDAQIHTYLQTLGLTPEQINTEISLSGDAKAKFTLQFMQGQLDKLDAGAQAEVLALIDQGHYKQAEDQITTLTAARTVPVKPVVTDVVGLTRQLMSLGVKPTGSAAMVPTEPTVGTTATAPVVVQVPAPNVTITMPAGATPANTLAAIRRYQRLGGDMGGLLDTVVAIR
jgi:hypothetical protein